MASHYGFVIGLFVVAFLHLNGAVDEQGGGGAPRRRHRGYIRRRGARRRWRQVHLAQRGERHDQLIYASAAPSPRPATRPRASGRARAREGRGVVIRACIIACANYEI